VTQSGALDDGRRPPLLRSFLAPLTVTACNGTRTYDGTMAFAGSLTYSETPIVGVVLGTPSYELSSKDAGTRSVTPVGLYSHQLGYDLRAVNGQVGSHAGGP